MCSFDSFIFLQAVHRFASIKTWIVLFVVLLRIFSPSHHSNRGLIYWQVHWLNLQLLFRFERFLITLHNRLARIHSTSPITNRCRVHLIWLFLNREFQFICCAVKLFAQNFRLVFFLFWLLSRNSNRSPRNISVTDVLNSCNALELRADSAVKIIWPGYGDNCNNQNPLETCTK